MIFTMYITCKNTIFPDFGRVAMVRSGPSQSSSAWLISVVKSMIDMYRQLVLMESHLE